MNCKNTLFKGIKGKEINILKSKNCNYCIYKIIEKATNCQGASRVSNTALAQRARPNLQGNWAFLQRN